MSLLARLIRQRRVARGLTQTQLAKLCEVTTSAVAFWERGEFVPRGYRLAALSEALGIDMKELPVRPAGRNHGRSYAA